MVTAVSWGYVAFLITFVNVPKMHYNPSELILNAHIQQFWFLLRNMPVSEINSKKQNKAQVSDPCINQ